MEFEVIVALFILIMIVGTTATFWLTQTRSFDNQTELNTMRSKATLAFDTITSDKNVMLGGIVNEKRIIDSEKMSAFSSTNYDELRDILSIGNYDFYFRIYDSNTTYMTKGAKTDTGNAIALQRPMSLNGSAVKGELILYEIEDY